MTWLAMCGVGLGLGNEGETIVEWDLVWHTEEMQIVLSAKVGGTKFAAGPHQTSPIARHVTHTRLEPLPLDLNGIP